MHACLSWPSYTCGQGGSAWVNRGNSIRNSTFKNIGANAVYLLWQTSTVVSVCVSLCVPLCRCLFVLSVKIVVSRSRYLDDMMSGWTVEDSVFDNAANGIQIGGGRRNRVRNNQFINVAGSAVSLLVSLSPILLSLA